MHIVSHLTGLTITTALLAALGGHASPTNTAAGLQKAGKRVIYSYAGASPPQSLINAISSGQAAGVIFFGENIQGVDFPSVVKKLNAANPDASLPLLMMTDQEGGQVRRLSGAPTQSAKSVGSSSDPAAGGTSTGKSCAANMVSNLLNVNLAPILGVYRKAGNFLDKYERSYSMDPKIVASASSALITAQQAGGVAATAKHFPGLGAATASQDTDATPVTLNVSAADLKSIDMLPYHSAIAAGVKLVMPSWAVYPSLDTRPAGISPRILQTFLRGQLGFKGVTISDAIEAGGLNGFGTDPERAVLAAGAGMDLILAAARNVSQGTAIVQQLAATLNDGTLNSADFQASIDRITTLRKGLA